MRACAAPAPIPTPLPVQALDHATGYLMAAAAVRGLGARRGERRRIARARLARAHRRAAREPRRGAGSARAEEARTRRLSDPVRSHRLGPALRLRAPVEVEGAPMRWDIPAERAGVGAAALVSAWRLSRSGSTSSRAGRPISNVRRLRALTPTKSRPGRRLKAPQLQSREGEDDAAGGSVKTGRALGLAVEPARQSRPLLDEPRQGRISRVVGMHAVPGRRVAPPGFAADQEGKNLEIGATGEAQSSPNSRDNAATLASARSSSRIGAGPA